MGRVLTFDQLSDPLAADGGSTLTTARFADNTRSDDSDPPPLSRASRSGGLDHTNDNLGRCICRRGFQER